MNEKPDDQFGKPEPKNPAEEMEKKARKKQEEKRPLTPDQILMQLQSEDAQIRKVALGQLFPMKSAVLIACDPKDTRITATDNLNAPIVFQALLFVAMQVGKFLGLQLNWLPDPKAMEDEAKKLVVAPEGSI